MVHAGCVWVCFCCCCFCQHSPTYNMYAMECMCAQNRSRCILSSERVLGNEVRTHVNSRVSPLFPRTNTPPARYSPSPLLPRPVTSPAGYSPVTACRYSPVPILPRPVIPPLQHAVISPYQYSPGPLFPRLITPLARYSPGHYRGSNGPGELLAGGVTGWGSNRPGELWARGVMGRGSNGPGEL